MPDQPKQLGGAPKEPVIYTIPDQFYGLAAKAQLPREAAAPATPGAPPISAAPAPNAPPQKGSKAWILIPIVAVLLLGGIGFGIWMLMKPKAPSAPAKPSVTLPTTPTPQPEPKPEPTPEPVPEPKPATTTEEVPAAPDLTSDADGDSLTLAEETLFGTDPAKADSDDDGYSDSVELINLYNPAGFKPTKLIEAGLVKTFTPQAGGFEVLIPKAWSPSAGSTGTQVAAFEVDLNTTFFISMEENAGNQSALDWYLSRNPDVSPSQVKMFTTKSDLEGVRSPDGLSAYLPLDGNIYVLRQGMLNETVVGYGSTFTMFVNSFSKKP